MAEKSDDKVQFATVTLIANCCPKHRGRSDFKVFGPNTEKVLIDQYKNKITLPADSSQWDERSKPYWDWYYGSAVIVSCDLCGALTWHIPELRFGKKGPYGWKTIVPKRWRSRVTFSWPEQMPEQDRTGYNISQIHYKSGDTEIVLGLAVNLDGGTLASSAFLYRIVMNEFFTGTCSGFVNRLEANSIIQAKQLPGEYTRKISEFNKTDAFLKLIIESVLEARVKLFNAQGIKSKLLGKIRTDLEKTLRELGVELSDLTINVETK